MFFANLNTFWHQPKYAFYKEKPDVFPIALLPPEIQNEIGQYLQLRKTEETDKEFKNLLKNNSYSKSLNASFKLGNLSFCVFGNPIYICEQWDSKKMKMIWRYPLKDQFANDLCLGHSFVKLYTFNPDLSAIAVVVGCLSSVIDIIHYKEQLYIYDFKTKEYHSCIIKKSTKNGFKDDDEQSVSFRKISSNWKSTKATLFYEGALNIAMSINKQVAIANDSELNLYRITNSGIKKSLFYDFKGFTCETIKFNKQETKIGISLIRLGIAGYVRIFPVDDTPKKINTDSNLLGIYFRQIGVCKNWEKLIENI